MGKSRLTNDEVREAKMLREERCTYEQIGANLDCSAHVARMHLDPEYAAHRKRIIASRNKKRPPKPRTVNAQVAEDAEQRLRSRPPDTRDAWARICGDPRPGESALDMARGQGSV